MGSRAARHSSRRTAALGAVGVLLAGALLGACAGAGTTMSSAAMSPLTTPDAAMGGGWMSGGSAAPASPMAAGGMQHAPADASSAWAGRPDYAKGTAATEEAYAYALFHPEAVAWMPCYCGCEAMDHRSNLDCYLKRGSDGSPTAFEEHASYCEICVETTLLTKQLMAEGRSLREIRAAVDAQFGGRAPGTPTELPPA